MRLVLLLILMQRRLGSQLVTTLRQNDTLTLTIDVVAEVVFPNSNGEAVPNGFYGITHYTINNRGSCAYNDQYRRGWMNINPRYEV